MVPSDIRIEALLYAQEKSFFIIPGPWFNPDPDDTYAFFVNGYDNDPSTTRASIPPDLRQGRRPQDSAVTGRCGTHPFFPFYGEPLDVRITLFGSVNENLPATVVEQGAWMEKWGWIPQYLGSTGLAYADGLQGADAVQPTMHGASSPFAWLQGIGVRTGTLGKAHGIVFEFDPRALDPYAPAWSDRRGLLHYITSAMTLSPLSSF